MLLLGGCSYTPEYYINIRTGTHYFPKCISSADSANRFKCGLNRIEEKNGEINVDDEVRMIMRMNLIIFFSIKNSTWILMNIILFNFFSIQRVQKK